MQTSLSLLLASHDILSSSRHLPAIIYIIYASVAVSPASTIVILSRPHLQLLSYRSSIAPSPQRFPYSSVCSSHLF